MLSKYLTDKQLRACHLLDKTGTVSRVDRTVIRLLDLAIDLDYLEPGQDAKAGNLYAHEARHIASAIGVSNERTIQRFRAAALSAGLRDILRRTAKADSDAGAFALAGEGGPMSTGAPTQETPLRGIVISDAQFFHLWDQCENIMCFEGELLRALDLAHACRRIVRQLIRVSGAKLTSSYLHMHQRNAADEPIFDGVISDVAVEYVAKSLTPLIQSDPRFTAAVERFQRITKFIFETLGAVVTYDIDADFAIQASSAKSL